jgi:hypothetical protein
MLAAYWGSHPLGSGELIPSLACKLSQNKPTMPSKSKVPKLWPKNWNKEWLEVQFEFAVPFLF